MAKIEKQFLEKEGLKTKKRKRKDEAACMIETESPSSKFKKLGRVLCLSACLSLIILFFFFLDISQTKNAITKKGMKSILILF